MANVVFKYWFDPEQTPYVDDFGSQQVFNPTVRIPTDLSTEQATSLIQCVNGVEREEPIPCTNQDFTPRRLIFRRQNGNSLTLIVPEIGSLKTYAQCIIDIFKDSQSRVVCVEYVGEQWGNIYDRFNTLTEAKNPVPPIEPDNNAAKNVVYYKGFMLEYQSESGQTYQQVRNLPFKSQSRENDVVLSELSTYFESCVGELTSSFCSTSRYIEYRRFIPGILTATGTGALNQGENKIAFVTAPAKSPEADSLAECANQLVQASGVVCLQYVGEKNSRFHLEGLDLSVA